MRNSSRRLEADADTEAGADTAGAVDEGEEAAVADRAGDRAENNAGFDAPAVAVILDAEAVTMGDRDQSSNKRRETVGTPTNFTPLRFPESCQTTCPASRIASFLPGSNRLK